MYEIEASSNSRLSQDLLSTVNKPEWPAAELLLSLLGKLLVQNFSNKSVDVLLRVASLEYLGVVAARLRRDAVTSQLRTETIDQLLKQVKQAQEEDEPNSSDEAKQKKHKKKKKHSSKEKSKEQPSEDRDEVLQTLLLDYLAVSSQSDPALLHARHFYLAQWYNDYTKASKKATSSEARTENTNEESQDDKSSKKKKKKKKRSHSSSGSSDSESSSSSDDENDETKKSSSGGSNHVGGSRDVNIEAIQRRKKLLLAKINPFPEAAPGTRTQVLTTPLDAESAELITRFLASKRAFSQSFDNYLRHILKVLRCG